LNFATDAWTSPNNKAYVAITVHFEQDGVPHLPSSQCCRSGNSYGHQSRECLCRHSEGLQSKIRDAPGFKEVVWYLLGTHRPQILLFTCDNLSANDAMIDHLAELLSTFPGAANRTWCFTHICNLVAKYIMKQFDLLKSKKGAKPDHDVADESDDEDFENLAVALDELEDKLEDKDKMEVGHEKIADKEIKKILDE
jgi:hypothetical protein